MQDYHKKTRRNLKPMKEKIKEKLDISGSPILWEVTE
jgi:hypothetical protein